MSLRERFVDGVSSLFDKLGDGDALSGVDPEALEKELAVRVEFNKGAPAPADDPRARVAAAGERARNERAKLAAERAARVHAEARQREEAEKRARDAAFRSMAEEARRQATAGPRPAASSNGTGASRGPGSSRGRPSIFQKGDLAQHYKTLGVEYGADSATVKKAYRQLMRKYHPDLHKDPKKKKAATELTMKISTAYAALEKSGKK